MIKDKVNKLEAGAVLITGDFADGSSPIDNSVLKPLENFLFQEIMMYMLIERRSIIY